MADLDEISSQIGELVAMSRSTQNQVTTLFTKFDKVNEEVIEQRGAIKLLGQQFLEHRTDDDRVHKIVSEIRRDFEETKNKGKGLIVGLGLLGGGGGLAGLSAFLKQFLGGGH